MNDHLEEAVSVMKAAERTARQMGKTWETKSARKAFLGADPPITQLPPGLKQETPAEVGPQFSYVIRVHPDSFLHDMGWCL